MGAYATLCGDAEYPCLVRRNFFRSVGKATAWDPGLAAA